MTAPPSAWRCWPVTAAGFAARMWDDESAEAEAVTYLERLLSEGWVDAVTVDGVAAWRVSPAGAVVLGVGGDRVGDARVA